MDYPNNSPKVMSVGYMLVITILVIALFWINDRPETDNIIPAQLTPNSVNSSRTHFAEDDPCWTP